MEKDAIIIGAGVAGLAAAIRLSCMGYRVQVFEKNEYPGGKLSEFTSNGYRFDAGPSLFTQPGNIEALFELAGEPISGYFNYRRVEVACHYFFSNGKRVKAWANHDDFAAEMQLVLGEPAENITRYLDDSARLYRNVGELFLKHSLHRPASFSIAEIKNALSAVKWPYLFQSLNGFNRHRFATAEASQLFNRYATYNGSNPYKAPAMLSLIPHLEMNEGTFYPEGGMISITNALYRLALKKNVRFYFNTPVSRILTGNRGVTGVEAGGIQYPAQLVVSNQDVYFTYKNLLQNEPAAQKVLQQERSSSALIYYWGIKHDFKELGLHNIFFSADYAAEFRSIFEEGTVGNDPTVYINITSKMEEGMAPPGCQNWFVMVNVPANSGQNWEALKSATRRKVLEKLGRVLGQPIENLVETEETLDPVTIENRTMSYMGSLYGTSSNSRMAAFLRHPNFGKGYRGLYFVGGSVHPGGGIPLCLRSAEIMCKMVAADFL